MSRPHISAQPCGCDPGCGPLGWLCERHRDELEVELRVRAVRAAIGGGNVAHTHNQGEIGSMFEVKDSGARHSFDSGMVRDVTDGKIGWHRVADGPMLRRWAEHLAKGARKYPDVAPGVANWTLAEGDAELARFRESAFRHFMAWFYGEQDEDHAAAVYFNINGAEDVRAKQGGE